MATLLAHLQGRADETVPEAIPGIDLLTPEDGYALFDRRARKLLSISGQELLLRWDAGAYRHLQDNAEGRKIGEFIMMMPFARRTKS